MATGYLVTLGDGDLDVGDAISGAAITFTDDRILGNGRWIWTGNAGADFTNESEPGVFILATNGNTYFVPDLGTVTTLNSASIELTPPEVDGTAGDDDIDLDYTGDPEGHEVTTGDDSIEGNGGDDTIFGAGGEDEIDGGAGADTAIGGGGNDTIDGGADDDLLIGDQTVADGGEDTIFGGTGNDTIYGDNFGDTDAVGSATTFNWSDQTPADEADVSGGLTGLTANGDVRVTLSVEQGANFTSTTMETTDPLFDYDGKSDTSSIDVFGGANGTASDAAVITLDFTAGEPGYFDEVSNVQFGIFDLDELEGQFIDQVIIRAYDANGNLVPVTLTAGNAATITTGTDANGVATATSVVNSGGAGATDSASGFVRVDVAGPVSRIEIEYNNVDPDFGNHAIRIGDIGLTSIPIDEDAGSDDILDGGAGDDVIFGQGGNDSIQGGTGVDSLFGGAGDDFIEDSGLTTDFIEGGDGDDTINSGGGADEVYGGDGADSIRGAGGNDEVFGGEGNDSINGEAGRDTLFGGAGDDTITGDAGSDFVYGGAGNDSLLGGTGNDSVEGGTGNDNLSGGIGNDTLDGGAGNDTLSGDAGNDTLIGSAGNDESFGGTGDDLFVVADNTGTETIAGGEDADGADIDTVDFNTPTTTDGVTVTFTGDEAGTYDFDGSTASGSFIEIERVLTTDQDDTVDASLATSPVIVEAGDGDDSLTGSTGDDTIDAGEGADTIAGGRGDDTINLGTNPAGTAPDGDADVIVLEDSFGDDIVSNFDAPTPNGDGTFDGIDTLDVTNLNDASNTPVTVSDVTVTDDGFGNAVLTFPRGESITLEGISPTDAADTNYLEAIGIPADVPTAQDGIVSGDGTDNLIDLTYSGDPDGDFVDNNDALLAGETGNDDIIEGLGGSDSILGGDGNDQIFGDAKADPDAGIGQPAGQLFTDATNIQAGSATGNPADAQVGDSVIYNDAATLANGDVVAIRVTVVSISDPDVTVILNDSQASSPLRVVGGADENGEAVQFKVEFLDQATGLPLTLTGEATIVDIDDNNSIGGISGIENVQFDENDITSYSVSDTSSLAVSSTGGVVTATGTQTNNAANEDAWFAVGFEDRSEINFTVGVVDGTANYGFSGLDLTNPVTTEITGSADEIDGGVGDDYIAGNGGDDILTGGEGDDTILGGTGSDTIFGGGGDTIIGGEDADGADVDVLNAGNAVSVAYTDVDGNPVAGPTEFGTITYADGSTLDFSEIETLNVTLLDGTVSGTAGDDLIDGSYTGDPDGDIVDNNDAILAGDTANDDLIEANGGDDSVLAGDGDDEVYGGTGDDTLDGGVGDDTLFGDDGSDTFTIADADGTDAIIGGEDAADTDTDTVDFSGVASPDGVTVTYDGDESADYQVGTAGSDGTFDEIEAIVGTDNADTIDATLDTAGFTAATGAGDDAITGGAGDDTIDAGTGNDTISLTNGFGTDTIVGGEDGAGGDVDVLDALGITSNIVLDITSPETGTLTTGGNTATFSEVEEFVLGSGDDSVTGSDGDDVVDLGQGADTINAGLGNDQINLGEDSPGNPDQDPDVVVLEDNFGDDVVTNFDAPTDNGDGTFTGIDTLDVTNLFDAPVGDPTRTAVDTNDVVVSDDGSGNAVLTFPNGETITLVGIDPVDAADPAYLNAIGIPTPDGTVSGTAGNDLIDGAYLGDPDGDIVDNNDAILPGDTGNDDLIFGFEGNDEILAGDGADEIFGGDGDDSISGGVGDDVIYGDAATGGWQYEYYDLDPAGNPLSLEEAGFIGGGTTFDGTPTDTGYSNSINPTDYDTADDFALKFTSALNITTGGEYTFATASDDGSKLFIDGVEVVNNDGNHAVQTESGTITLTPGVHVIEIIYYENNGGNALTASIAGPDTGGVETALTNYDGLNEAAGDDIIDGGDGNDTIFGGLGDDAILLGDGFGVDTIDGNEDGDNADVDVLDASAMTTDATLDLSGADPETGTLTEGANVATFDNIEEFVLGSGDDSVTGSDGDDVVDLGQGADTINAGLGNDQINLGEDSPGNPDQDPDVVVLEDDFGDDIITNFDAPTPDGDGTFTGIDTLDVTDLFDAPVGDPTRTPVNTNDVVVSDDGAGNAVLTFPNGETLTLVGIPPADADNPFYLNAIGIPLPDGTVSGGAGDDLIDGSYLGDPDGDIVDNDDAILAGDTANDDLIEANGGNDSVLAGDGDDEVYGGTGDDTLDGGVGDDTLFGDAGDDTFTIADADGTDTITGGEDAGDADLDNVDFSGVTGTEGVDVTFSGDEAGNYAIGDAGSDGTFTEIEGIVGTDNTDDIDLTGDTTGIAVDSGDGDDTVTSGDGDDVIDAGAGQDTVVINDNYGNDDVTGGEVADGTGDVLDGSTLTQDVTVDFTAPETGTVTNGTDTLTFAEIEAFFTGSGDDTVLGGAGDDVVNTGAGDDTILGGAGDDVFDAGAGNDTINGGIGDDDIIAGTGDDTIQLTDNFGDDTITGGEDAGDGDTDVLDATGVTVDTVLNLTAPETGTLTDGTDTASMTEIEEFRLGSGDDSATGSTGDDVIDLGAGNDSINAGEGDDIITGGTGDDTIAITDNFGNDTIDAGEDAGDTDVDVLDGSGLTDDVTVTLTGAEVGTVTDGTDTLDFTGVEEIVTGSGDDTVIGGAGNDSVSTGAGDDVISGGAGTDTFDAGDGDDVITFAEGDSIDGGDGNDTFTLEDLGEPTNGVITIEGGDGDEDPVDPVAGTGGDVLQLGDLADLSTLVQTSDGINASGNETFSGTVELDDGTTLNFSGIEQVICFTPGTNIATPKGARPIETLRVGDMIVTRDHGLQPIRWIQQRTVPATDKFAPVRLRPGTVTGLERDLIVSPQHRMLFQGYRAELLFGESEVLMPATHLIDGKAVTREEGGFVTYIHMMFDEHEVIYAEGAASESFHPGEVGLTGVTDAAREELFALFPDLRSDPTGYGRTARRTLKIHESQMLRTK